MTGAATWTLIGLGVVIGWCARDGWALWQAKRGASRPRSVTEWRRQRRAHRVARQRLAAFQRVATLQEWH